MNILIERIIKQKINNGIIVLSPANIKIDIIANKNLDISESNISEKNIKEILKKINRLVRINDNQFIEMNSVILILGYNIYNDLLKESNYKDLINMIIYLIKKRHPVFEIEQVFLENYFKKEKIKREARTKIVNSMINLFLENKNSIDINDIINSNINDFDNEFLINEKNEIFNEFIFYQITPKKFVLNSWILLNIAKNGFSEYKIVNFNFLSNIIIDLLNTMMINRHKLKNLLIMRPEFNLINNGKKVKFNTTLEVLENNIYNLYKKYIFINDVELYGKRKNMIEKNKDYDEINTNEKTEDISFNDILNQGISNGSIYSKDLNKINYNNSKVKNRFEAMKILDEKNIEIIFPKT